MIDKLKALAQKWHQREVEEGQAGQEWDAAIYRECADELDALAALASDTGERGVVSDAMVDAALGAAYGYGRRENMRLALIAALRAQPAGGGSCTCPSGDGSLRWPCPQHPPAPSAGVSEAHHYVMDEEARDYECCQKCGHVRERVVCAALAAAEG
jgi:hypothetical protein